ncbi:hypothetical protein ABVT39_020327 [Epinephelus coioides]
MSGSEASGQRPWRYTQVMSFLNPFMEERATSSNMPAASQSSQEQGEFSAASQITEPSQMEEEITLYLEPVPPDPETPTPTPIPTPTLTPTPALTPTPTPTPSPTPITIPTPTPTSTPSTSRERFRPQKRAHENTLSPFERQLMDAMEKAVSQAAPAAPPDPDYSSRVFSMTSRPCQLEGRQT